MEEKVSRATGILIALFSGAVTWSLIIWAVVQLAGCIPINLEASGSLNIGEHQGIHRRSESRVQTDEAETLFEDEQEEKNK